LKPEYNLCPKAGSSFGRVTSDQTKIKQREAALNRKTQPNPGFKVLITNIETNETTVYDSIRKAAIAINSDIKTILRREKQSEGKLVKPYRKKYIINIIRK
jgi:hypothetical protein